jgi:hypothetical protein
LSRRPLDTNIVIYTIKRHASKLDRHFVALETQPFDDATWRRAGLGHQLGTA